jgi:U5 snRNP spliceosome subunit
MSEPWEPPGQQSQAGESSTPAGGSEPTRKLPPAYPGAPPTPPAYPAYQSSDSPYPAYPAGNPGYPGYPANPYASPVQGGGPGGPGGPGLQPPAGPMYAGYQPYGAYQPYATSPPASGVTTITGAVIQLVQSTFWLVGGIVLVFAANEIANLVDDPEFGAEAADDARLGLVVGGVIVALVAAGMITLAILTLRRVNGCRIASAVMQMVLGILPLLGLLGAASDGNAGGVVFSLLYVASCAAAAWLLLLPTSARYCRGDAPRTPGY